MRKLISLALGTALLTGCVSTTPTTQVTNVAVELPKSKQWSVETDQADSTQYIKEWVPEGDNPLSAKWIITEQKLVLSSTTSADSFQRDMFALAKQSCSDVLYNGPQEIEDKGHKTSVGRIMCAAQNGKPYGTFTDQRVVVNGQTVYVVTSELRIPASEKAGVLAFGKDQLEEMKAFMSMQGESSKLVRESVTIEVQ